jgi:glycosyltransferase involved in cell wall biosynthesis
VSEPLGTKQPALLVFSDDWGRHPSSCQHLVRRLLPKYHVVWVNTIGLRRPAMDWVTLSRGFGKIAQWLRPKKTAAGADANPRVLNPRMWPWFSGWIGRRLNRYLLTRHLAPVLKSVDAPVIAITTVPIVADLADAIAVDRWVYYCVDDFSKWPGLDQAIIGQMEEKLVRRADVLIAVSEKLRQRLAGWARSSTLLTHGVDLEHWRLPSHGSAASLDGLERPLVMFWGLIDWQMDLDFLRRLSADMERGTIVLVGPRTDHDAALFSIPRVVHVPKVPYDELPALADEAAVLVMPYRDAPGLRESQPLKLKEYLATNKPAVVRDLPANRVWADALDLVSTAEGFSCLVRRRLASGLPSVQTVARQRLTSEGWDDKARRFEEWVVFGPRSPSIEETSDGQ